MKMQAKTRACGFGKALEQTPSAATIIVMTQTIADISVSVRKNGDLIFVAEWTDSGYAHSITSEDGLTADELETLVSEVH